MEKTITWHIEKRKIADLKPYKKNPRQLTKDQEAHLTVSVDKFGLIDRPVINLDGTIIGGHQRIHVLHKLEHDEIEVMLPSRHLSDKEVEECNIRLNRNTGEWDWDCLANMWEIDDLIDYGFTMDELGVGASTEFDDKVADVTEEKCPMCNQKVKK